MQREQEHSEKPAWFNSSALGKSIVERILSRWPREQWQDVTVAVAVSGGADSVALLRLMDWMIRRTGESQTGRLIVANFDHGWRADSSDDSKFVADLARTLGWDCIQGRAEPATDEKPNESGAREARYRFLNSVAADSGARYIVTGHTANDQAETILHRILRGTGLHGLSGIPPLRVVNEAVTIVRPLLDIRREELLELLTAIEQPYRDDSTNSNEQFTRNRLRHKLLPELREDYNAEVDAALVRLGALAGEVQSHLSLQVAAFVDEHCKSGSDDTAQVISINAVALADLSPLITREVFRHLWKRQSWPLQSMGFAEWERLEKLAHGSVEAKTTMFPGCVAVTVENRRLVLQRNDKNEGGRQIHE